MRRRRVEDLGVNVTMKVRPRRRADPARDPDGVAEADALEDDGREVGGKVERAALLERVGRRLDESSARLVVVAEVPPVLRRLAVPFWRAGCRQQGPALVRLVADCNAVGLELDRRRLDG